MTVEMLAGDCLEVLPTLAENSMDSCVCDPPYHLVSVYKRFANEARTEATVGNGAYGRHAKGFMGKQWDGGDIAFRPDVWREVCRVLKPGAHLLAFGGDRTQHRLACAIEDAGFEIRGTIAWIFGSGFPKNHDVSKRMREYFSEDALCACDRLGSQTIQDFPDDYLLSNHCDDEPLPCDQDGVLDVSPLQVDARARNRDGLPLDDQALRQANNGLDAGNAPRSNGGSSRQAERLLEDCPASDNTQSGKPLNKSRDEVKAARKTARHKSGTSRSGDGLVSSSLRNVNLPQCPRCGKLIVQDGIGTALKPAMELICLARKPLSESTVAANVVRWGTGAINVDGCRVETDAKLSRLNNARDNAQTYNGGSWKTGEFGSGDGKGRWPANLIHDGSEEVLAGFPESDSVSGGTTTKALGRMNDDNWIAKELPRNGHDDSGSAARFFYTAKADTYDRLGSRHPTVKPLDLMQYLVRLVTPKGGLVLDPFAGTGTTGEAAFREGMRAVLIEREAEYQADIKRRIAMLLGGPEERAREAIKERMKDKPRDDGPLFA